MSSLPRTIKGFFALGPARFMRQLNNMGDTKVGTLVGVDKFGNKYFENYNESYGAQDILSNSSNNRLNLIRRAAHSFLGHARIWQARGLEISF
ncbi:hypothetical protein DFQ26_006159 [Actinomortierella ambigua]|nr:hypothetical protein DFQ26_006159 [Actinomortierella ambigua]